MKTLILVDFDKTLYKKDSLFKFTKFYTGSFKFYLGIIFLTPVFLLMKLGIVSNQKTKEFFLTYFFKDEDYTFFKQKGGNFAKTKIEKNINLNLLNEINSLKISNTIVYIVSASFNEWIFDWANKYRFKTITSRLQVVDGKLTGIIEGKNCSEIEKVNRIKNEINLSNFDKIIVYGYGKGDFEMLKLEKN